MESLLFAKYASRAFRAFISPIAAAARARAIIAASDELTILLLSITDVRMRSAVNFLRQSHKKGWRSWSKIKLKRAMGPRVLPDGGVRGDRIDMLLGVGCYLAVGRL